jgi:hypothetical protein
MNTTDQQNVEREEEWVSECCSAPMCGEAMDIGLCPECMEHCEVVNLGATLDKLMRVK